MLILCLEMIVFRFGDDESVHKYDYTETTGINQVCYTYLDNGDLVPHGGNPPFYL